MRGRLLPLACGLVFLTTASISCARGDTAARVVATSPDQQISAQVSLAKRRNGEAFPVYSISFRGRQVILPSELGIDLAGGPALGHDSTIEEIRTRKIDESYTQHPGKRSRVTDHCEEVVIVLRERSAPSWRWEIVFRAYDDGVAFRYRFPAQESSKHLAIAAERTRIHISGNPLAYVLPLNSFTTSHEVRYRTKAVSEIPPEWLMGLPLLTELPGIGWLAVLEANLTDYAGMYLARGRRRGRPGFPAISTPG